ncbi:MAG: His-Xaa-Ser system radical SAM maturase HxsB [Burkholderiales bacterium]|nr:His-Xaa-Ser system radical SAM maturase HxsB [Burkholderiales bacterium]
MSKFRDSEAFIGSSPYRLLPFSFDRLDAERAVVTNMVGEHLVLPNGVLEPLVAGSLLPTHPLYPTLRSRHFLAESDDLATEELLELKTRTRTHRLAQFTSLHIFVATLRCDHSCPYCQVSRRQDSDSSQYDMSWDTASKALDLMFRSPNRHIKLEFQGGEPLLNFPLVQRVTSVARLRAQREGKSLQVVIATTLSLATDDVLEFCRANDVHLSCSLDGPASLHNFNRPRPGRDSYERFVRGLKRARDVVGRDRVAALMTTTEKSLGLVREIVDEYVSLGFDGIFLRPLSPYGFAVKTPNYSTYNTRRFLDFYFEGLEYIFDLNRAGVPIRELYASLVVEKIISNQDTGYVDLMSPAGIGIAAVVYDYDGSVYASDEARMLAQMGDKRFRMGSVHTHSYTDLMTSDELLMALEDSFTLSVPQCAECAFEPFCGADPVQHWALHGDVVGRKPESEFCQRNMGIFKYLVCKLEDDPEIARLLRSWTVRH